MTTPTCSLAPSITSLPLTLGYHPAASLVVILHREDTVVMTMRLDDDAVHTQSQACLDAVIRAADALPNVTSCDLVAYRSRPGRIDLATLAPFFARCLRVRHTARVDGDRWWIETCAAESCEATQHPGVERPAALSTAVFPGGHQPVPESRDEACASLRLMCPELAGTVEAIMAERAGRPVALQDVRAAWRLVVEAGTRGDLEYAPGVVHALAAILLGVVDGVLRDEMTGAIVPALHAGGPRWSEPPQSAAFLSVLRAVPDTARAEWLAFVALARWREGDRPGAVLAAQEANAHHLRCGLPRLVLEVVSSGVTHTFLTQRRRSCAAVPR